MVATLNNRGSASLFDPSTVNSMWRSAIIDNHRFCDEASRILARHEDVGPEGTHYPDEDALVLLGVNVDTLATCLDCGSITAAVVGELVALVEAGELSVEDCNDRIALTLVPADAKVSFADALTAASHLPSVFEAARFHPDDHLDRALHSKGLCSCHVEYVA